MTTCKVETCFRHEIVSEVANGNLPILTFDGTNIWCELNEIVVNINHIYHGTPFTNDVSPRDTCIHIMYHPQKFIISITESPASSQLICNLLYTRIEYVLIFHIHCRIILGAELSHSIYMLAAAKCHESSTPFPASDCCHVPGSYSYWHGSVLSDQKCISA
jgi:hypothetical protein